MTLKKSKIFHASWFFHLDLGFFPVVSEYLTLYPTCPSRVIRKVDSSSDQKPTQRMIKISLSLNCSSRLKKVRFPLLILNTLRIKTIETCVPDKDNLNSVGDRPM
jgi:hypothetical protein